MKHTIIATLISLAALAAPAQQPATAPADDAQQIVAAINGEKLTRAKFDMLWSSMTPQLRAQYEKSGGKTAFLENYIAKRLLIQEAIKSGFDKRPNVVAALDAAKDAALFDRYVREVVAAPLVSDADVRKYYDENQGDFAVPETAKIRHIVVAFNTRSKEEARQRIEQIAGELRAAQIGSAAAPPSFELTKQRFEAAARKYSDDGSAQSGGDLGWNGKGALDPVFEETAFAIKPGLISSVVETKFGYHLIFVEEKKPAGTEPFEKVKNDIRDFLVSQRGSDVMANVKRLTNELRANSKVSVYPNAIAQ